MAAAIKENLAVSAQLEELFDVHHARVIRAAYKITGNMPDAEDVAQTVFLRIAQGAPEGTVERAESYLYRAAINAAIDLLRKRQRENAFPIDELSLAGSAAPDRDCELRELRSWLRRALTTLDPRTAQMFVLRYFEDLDNREIAHILGTSQAVVAVLLHRARARLRKNFRAFMRGKKDDA